MKFYVYVGVHTGNEGPKYFPEIRRDCGAVGFKHSQKVKNLKISEN
jgi:hypothetical protein